MTALPAELIFDEQFMEACAKAAGLQIALEEFRADLIAAARLVEKHRRALEEWPEPSQEPWPPMRPDTAR